MKKDDMNPPDDWKTKCCRCTTKAHIGLGKAPWARLCGPCLNLVGIARLAGGRFDH